MSLRSVQATSATTREALTSARLVRREIQKEIQLLQEQIRKLKAKYRWAVQWQGSGTLASVSTPLDVSHEMQLSRQYASLNKRLRQANSRRIGKLMRSEAVIVAMQDECLERAATLHDAYKHQAHIKRRPWVRHRTVSDREVSRTIKKYRRALKKAEEKLAMQRLLLRHAQRDVVTARHNHQYMRALQQGGVQVQQLLRRFAKVLQVPAVYLQDMPLYVECHYDETLHVYIGNPRNKTHGHIVLNRYDKVVYYRLPGEPHGRQNLVA